MRFMTLTAVLAGAVVLSLPVAQAAGGRKKVSAVRITPSGATLRAGENLQLGAEAKSGRRSFAPATAKWKSSRPSVASVSREGLVTAGQTGVTNVSAKVRNLTAKASVAVVDTPQDGGSFVAAGLGEIFDVMTDDEWVYWTETSFRTTRIRKTARTGGPIFDLVSEPLHDKQGLKVTYVHLQEAGDRLYFTRQRVGLAPHWGIRSVTKAGDDVQQVLPEDVGTTPLAASGWRISGRFLVATVRAPEVLRCPANTRVAILDTTTGEWSALLVGQFELGKTFIVAVDGTHAYIRGYRDSDKTDVVRVSLSGGGNLQTLQSVSGEDGALGEPGTTDGERLFFWSKRADSDFRLVSLPTDGSGEGRAVATGVFGSGLTVDQGTLFWAEDQTDLVAVPVEGGEPQVLARGLVPTGTAGGIALEPAGIFVPKAESGLLNAIIRIDR